jgi:hypothetical protein
VRPARQPCTPARKRLSQALGDKAWRESGLGAPGDVDQLKAQITVLEQ